MLLEPGSLSSLSVMAITLPRIDPIMIEIGPLAIRYYSLAYLGGFIFAWVYLRKLAGLPGTPFSKEHVDDLVTWGVVGVIAGGRLGYVLFYNLPFYIDNPMNALYLWDGGMSFHGGFLGVCLAIFLFCRKRSLDIPAVGDRIALISPIGLLLGRIANFINGELWGRPTDVPWAMIFPGDPAQLPRHPSQFYEAFGEGLLLFVVLMFLFHKTAISRTAPGAMIGVFIGGYGLVRFLVEYARSPDAHLGLTMGLSRGQMLSLPMVLAGIAIIIWAKKKAQTKRK